jgi:predicted RNase H-like HicB family nuclease
MATYIALMRKDPSSHFGVDFHDFPGCVTAAATMQDARRGAVEALALHVAGMVEDGEVIPAPSTLDEIMADPANRDAVAVLIDAPMQAVRAVRLNITLPENVLRDIDRATTNRSAASGQSSRCYICWPLTCC